ncbi:hypothetical protein EYF80_031128 [Liparis tanakae]|uniref:Uncharacterized protein n=1 Tax=Liparis tanakae TaxID=230148 RepID=A0A4Z2GZU9_9TELE|nr:hypothetical protein EYF80_031128 [Liparis tanakae]
MLQFKVHFSPSTALSAPPTGRGVEAVVVHRRTNGQRSISPPLVVATDRTATTGVQSRCTGLCRLKVRAERTRPGGKEALLEFLQERDEERDREAVDVRQEALCAADKRVRLFGVLLKCLIDITTRPDADAETASPGLHNEAEKEREINKVEKCRLDS